MQNFDDHKSEGIDNWRSTLEGLDLVVICSSSL